MNKLAAESQHREISFRMVPDAHSPADPYLTCSRFRIHTASPTLGHRAFSMSTPTFSDHGAASTHIVAMPYKLEYATNVLAWEELGCHVPNRRHKGEELALLQGACGSARSGDLVAIIGKHLTH